MSKPVELTLEQQFSVHRFNGKVDQMSHEKAKIFLRRLYKDIVINRGELLRLEKETIRHGSELRSLKNLVKNLIRIHNQEERSPNE